MIIVGLWFEKKIVKDFIMFYIVLVYSCICNKCCKEIIIEYDKFCMILYRKGVMVLIRVEEKWVLINE